MKEGTFETLGVIYCGVSLTVCLIAMLLHGVDAVDVLIIRIGGLITTLIVVGGVCGAFRIGYGAIKYLYAKATRD